jgi:hypothetical protein
MGMKNKYAILLAISQFVLFWFLWPKMSMYYTQVVQNFSHFTTVIVINFEADYLLNRWTYRTTGVSLVHNF